MVNKIALRKTLRPIRRLRLKTYAATTENTMFSVVPKTVTRSVVPNDLKKYTSLMMAL